MKAIIVDEKEFEYLDLPKSVKAQNVILIDYGRLERFAKKRWVYHTSLSGKLYLKLSGRNVPLKIMVLILEEEKGGE